MGRDFDRDHRIACAAWSRVAFAGQTDLLAVFDTRWQFQVDCLAIAQCDPLRRSRGGIGEWHDQPIGHIAAAWGRTA